MALVLNEVQRRSGETRRFDVVRAEDKTIESGLLEGIPAGEYKVLGDDNTVSTVSVSYRTVQDVAVK